jgi:hypothetical protein
MVAESLKSELQRENLKEEDFVINFGDMDRESAMRGALKPITA